MPLFQDPNTAIIALLIGILGILFEFHAPGTIFPGVIGSSLVLLSAAALSRFPISPGAVVLIAVATLLLFVELKISSAGILSATGAVLLACGTYLLVDSPDPALHIRPVIAFAVALPVALLFAFLITIAARASANKEVTGINSLIGKTGTVARAADAESPLCILVAGEYWNALSAQHMAPGSSVRITAVQGLQVSVEPLHDTISSI